MNLEMLRRNIAASREGLLWADAVENVLDPIHTLFVHKGLIRGEGKQTSKVTISAGV